jgi:hypothetical protein
MDPSVKYSNTYNHPGACVTVWLPSSRLSWVVELQHYISEDCRKVELFNTYFN